MHRMPPSPRNCHFGTADSAEIPVMRYMIGCGERLKARSVIALPPKSQITQVCA
jgi:hypothetical protein